MFFPKDIMSLRTFYKEIKQRNIAFYIIGKGTNLLINERFFNSVFINLSLINRIGKISKTRYYIPSGITASKAALTLAQKGLTKCEFLSVIPGSIGGAIYMNAGAYSYSISDIIEYVVYLDFDNDLQLIKKEDCFFKYRSSCFKNRNGIIIGAIVNLQQSRSLKAPLEKIKYYVSCKKETQPLNKKSAGSTFKNNDTIYAWKVIDKLGYRGKKLGGAKISEKHTNFIINDSNATFNDIYELMMLIKDEAKNKLDVMLECEWEILK